MIVKAKLKKMFKNIFFSRFALAHLQNRNAAIFRVRSRRDSK